MKPRSQTDSSAAALGLSFHSSGPGHPQDRAMVGAAPSPTRAPSVHFIFTARPCHCAFLRPSKRGMWPRSTPSEAQPSKTGNCSKVLAVAASSVWVQSQRKKQVGQMARVPPGPPFVGSPSAGWEMCQ